MIDPNKTLSDRLSTFSAHDRRSIALRRRDRLCHRAPRSRGYRLVCRGGDMIRVGFVIPVAAMALALPACSGNSDSAPAATAAATAATALTTTAPATTEQAATTTIGELTPQ